MVLLDTCVASYLMNAQPLGREYARRFLDGRVLAISEMTLREMTLGSTRWTRELICQQLACVVLSLSDDVDELAELLREMLLKQGRQLGAADARIAATALLEGLILVTHDADFLPLQAHGLVVWTLLE